jgi:peptidyl-prolyl cis-trans isomerase SurA
MKRYVLKVSCLIAAILVSLTLSAQKYGGGVIDKTVAVIGNEAIMISDIEEQVQMMRAQGMSSDRNLRCEVLEQMMESKLFLMQARIDSLTVNQDMVASEMSSRLDQVRTSLGGDEEVEKYFGKPLYRLRQEWTEALQDQNLTQQEQSQVASNIPELTPYDVKQYLDTVDKEDLPIVPIKYRLSQICVYPDREAANLAVKEKLLSLESSVYGPATVTSSHPCVASLSLAGINTLLDLNLYLQSCFRLFL